MAYQNKQAGKKSSNKKAQKSAYCDKTHKMTKAKMPQRTT